MIRAALVLALAASAPQLQAQERQPLLAPAAGDLVPARAVGVERPLGRDVERAAIEFFQPLQADTALYPGQPHVAESREYWQRVDGDTLRAGFPLALTAPGAVVLVSPTVRAQPLLTDQVALRSGGRLLAFDQAADLLVDAQALRAAGMDVRPGSAGFRLRPGFERDAELVIEAAQGDYVVHVLEPNSAQVLSLQGEADTVHAGGEIRARLDLAEARIDTAAAVLVAPDGSSHDLRVVAGEDGQWLASVVVPSRPGSLPGLWEVHATVAGAEGERLFQRDARTAIAVVTPTARLSGDYHQHIARGGQAMVLRFGLEVATPGRYEVRGVVYGTDAKGEAVPLGVAHSAAWLERGQGGLSLSLPVLDRSDVGAPYQVRDLRLYDQVAVALLERRERAVTFD